MQMTNILLFSLLLLLSNPSLLSFSHDQQQQQPPPSSSTVCIIGSGIAGASVAHFLRQYSPGAAAAASAHHPPPSIRIFERHGVVGGRMATVSIGGHTFEAGASILHPKNYHALNFTNSLKLKIRKPSPLSSFSLGIWDGHRFLFKTLNSNSKLPVIQRAVNLANALLMFFRYGLSLLRMSSFVEETVDSFLKYYESFETRPVFHSVEEMLKWAGLYDLTTTTLEEKLVGLKLSPLLIQELITVITRINYGQSVSISGLAGAVSLAGSGGGLWSVEGGNWQMAAGLINGSDVKLHLHEEIESISYQGDIYELNSTKGSTYKCEVTVIATPLDELKIQFVPAVSIPEHKLQHTHATFIRGLLNPAYFGLPAVSDIPELIGTTEVPGLPFTSISVLKEHSDKDVTYKLFSREPLTDELLDKVFSVRNETIRINWAAYPHYHAPERFAPFLLDNWQLYYVNAFENAASTMETSAVAAENIARLILSRFFGQLHLVSSKRSNSDISDLRADL